MKLISNLDEDRFSEMRREQETGWIEEAGKRKKRIKNVVCLHTEEKDLHHV